MKVTTVCIPDAPYCSVPVQAFAGIPIKQQQNGDFIIDPIRWHNSHKVFSEKMQLSILGESNLALLDRQLPNRQAIYECSLGGAEHDKFPVILDPSGLDDDQLLLLVCGYEFNLNHAKWKQLSSVRTFEQSSFSKLFGNIGAPLYFDSLWVLQPGQPLELRFWTGPNKPMTLKRWVDWDGKTISIWQPTFWHKLNEESQHQDKIVSFMTNPEHHFADFFLEL